MFVVLVFFFAMLHASSDTLKSQLNEPSNSDIKEPPVDKKKPLEEIVISTQSNVDSKSTSGNGKRVNTFTRRVNHGGSVIIRQKNLGFSCLFLRSCRDVLIGVYASPSVTISSLSRIVVNRQADQSSRNNNADINQLLVAAMLIQQQFRQLYAEQRCKTDLLIKLKIIDLNIT
jgi:hypothetical protein